MGSTNHGTQTVSHKYYEEVTANNRNVRLKDIIARGIYDGGYLERTDDTEVKMTAATVEIGDDNVQVRVETSAYAYIRNDTVDSGALSPATPYIALRWAYTATQINYMEIHMLSSVSAAQANDIIVGRVVFSGTVITGFDYSERTILPVASQWFRPRQEGNGTNFMYVLVRSGRVHTGSGYTNIQEYSVGPFVAPVAPYSRIDLIYIDDSGVPQVLQGTPAVTPTAPSYGGRLVIAEVTVINGDTGIPQSRIRDVRTFVSRNVIPDNQTVQFNATTGRLEARIQGLLPKWNVDVCDANNYTTPGQFVSPVVTFSVPSFGSFGGTWAYYDSYWLYNNSVRLRMTVNSVGSNTKNLKLFAVDNWVYVYVDNVLVFQRTSVFNTTNAPLNIALNLTNGQHVIDVVFADQGGEAYLNILGDIVDGTNVKFVS